jgi:hypothetical protein
MSILCLSVTLTVFAGQQKPPEKPKVPAVQQQPDVVEDAHEGIFANTVDKATEASRLTEAVAGGLPASADVGEIPRKNFIDDQIFGRMEQDGVPHAPLASDGEFFRRAHLDATGLIPTADAVRAFVSSTEPDKRDRLIDSLVGTDEFADQWAWFYGDLFRTRDASFQWFNKQWLKADRPYDQVLYDIIATAAKAHTMMPALQFYAGELYSATRAVSPTDPDNYFLMDRLDFVDESTIDIARIFLGVNLDCVSCHDGAAHLEGLNSHLTRQTREGFYRQAAFLGKMRAVVSYSDRALNISNANTIMDNEANGYTTGDDAPFHTMARTRFPRDGKTYEPAFLLTGEKPRPGEDPRKALARIIPTHIQFGRAAANLIWSKLMVVGFVSPYDGFDLDRLDPENPPAQPWTIQPTNPELLDAMAKDFRDSDFSLQHLIKTVMKSSAYQLSAQFPGEWKEAYIPYYARRFVRVLTGPEMADAVAEATGRPYSFNLKGLPVSRVKELTAPSGVSGRPAEGEVDEGGAIYALMQAFFQSTRETPAFLGNKASPMQAMLLMVSPVVTNRSMAADGTRLHGLLESGKSQEEIIEEIFLATLARPPSPAEVGVSLQLMEKDRKQGVESIQWALLNSTEFILNH